MTGVQTCALPISLHARSRRKVRFQPVHIEGDLPARFAGEDVGRRPSADDLPPRKLGHEFAQVGVVLLVEGRSRADEQVARLILVEYIHLFRHQ